MCYYIIQYHHIGRYVFIMKYEVWSRKKRKKSFYLIPVNWRTSNMLIFLDCAVVMVANSSSLAGDWWGFWLGHILKNFLHLCQATQTVPLILISTTKSLKRPSLSKHFVKGKFKLLSFWKILRMVNAYSYLLLESSWCIFCMKKWKSVVHQQKNLVTLLWVIQ